MVTSILIGDDMMAIVILTQLKQIMNLHMITENGTPSESYRWVDLGSAIGEDYIVRPVGSLPRKRGKLITRILTDLKWGLSIN